MHICLVAECGVFSLIIINVRLDQISLDYIQRWQPVLVSVVSFSVAPVFLSSCALHPLYTKSTTGPLTTPVSWDSRWCPMFSRAGGREQHWGHRAGKTELWRLLLPSSLLFALWFTPDIGFGVDMPHQRVNTDVTCTCENHLVSRTFQNTHREGFSLPFLVWTVTCLWGLVLCVWCSFFSPHEQICTGLLSPAKK